MIFIDSNVPMYLVGASHPNRDRAVASVFAITRADVGIASEIAARNPSLSARDCLHLAVMQENGIDRVLTFDQGFADHSGVEILP